ncbi:MAG: hypothetical protein QXF12_04245 [Candidatus Aenigmatarchaeota archaeon]
MSMRILARIIPAEVRASDGSYFTKEALINYLDSPQYHYRRKSKTCLGAVTHAYRDKDLSRSSVIAVIDELLLNRIITHYVDDMFFENNWLMGYINLLDANLIQDKEAAAWIYYVEGLIKNGVELPVSAFVAGKWDGDKCIEVVDIAGVDFTLDPGFKEASIILDKNKKYSRSLDYDKSRDKISDMDVRYMYNSNKRYKFYKNIR